MTEQDDVQKMLKMQYYKLAQDTAKGMWPGDGATGQNTGIVLEAITNAIRADRAKRDTFPHCSECGSSAWYCCVCQKRDTLDEMLVELAGGRDYMKLTWFVNRWRIEVGINEFFAPSPTEAAKAALDEMNHD